MADIHCLTQSKLHQDLLYPVHEQLCSLGYDSTIHAYGPWDTLVERLTGHECRVAVVPQFPDKLFATETPFKTLMIQHGQYPSWWSEEAENLADYSILNGPFWREHWPADCESDAPGHALAPTILDRIRNEHVPGGPKMLYAAPMLVEHKASYREAMDLMRAHGVWIKMHPREPDGRSHALWRQGVSVYPPRDSIYRCLQGLDLLITGPSNLIFEAALARVPCVLLNFDKQPWVDEYAQVVHVVHSAGELADLVRRPPAAKGPADVEPFWRLPDAMSLERVVSAVDDKLGEWDVPAYSHGAMPAEVFTTLQEAEGGGS